MCTLEPDDPAWEQAAAQVERSQHLAALEGGRISRFKSRSLGMVTLRVQQLST